MNTWQVIALLLLIIFLIDDMLTPRPPDFRRK